MSDDDVPRIGSAAGSVTTYHGPVSMRDDEQDIGVITFVGAEEADLLHAAGTWMTEHPWASICSINWTDLIKLDGQLGGENVVSEDAMPGHVLALTVDRNAERH